MVQKRRKVNRRSHRPRQVEIRHKDIGVAKVAQLRYNITMKDIMDYIKHEIERMKKDRQRVLQIIEEYRAKGMRPPVTTAYLDEAIPRYEEFYKALKELKNDKERWEYLNLHGWKVNYYSVPLLLRALVFDKYDFPVVSKLVGREVVDLDEGPREFMTESDSCLIRYWDKDGRVYSVWTKWEPETEKPPFKGTITFIWEPGYEG